MGLIDCCLRSPVLQAVDAFAPAGVLVLAFDAVLGCEAALANTAAVAGLASALTSLVKRAVQFTEETGQRRQQQQQQEEAAAASSEPAMNWAGPNFPAVLPKLASEALWPLADAICAAAERLGSSSSQAAASTALLAVVAARSLVQLADAMQAAGAEMLFDCLAARPMAHMMWSAGSADCLDVREMLMMGEPQQHNMEGQWQCL
jgi:hypothetical protein